MQHVRKETRLARRLPAAGAGRCSALGQCCLPGRQPGPAQLRGQLPRLPLQHRHYLVHLRFQSQGSTLCWHAEGQVSMQPTKP